MTSTVAAVVLTIINKVGVMILTQAQCELLFSTDVKVKLTSI